MMFVAPSPMDTPLSKAKSNIRQSRMTTSSDVVIRDCLMFDFAFDKGVSIGEGATNIIVTNCLIYGCDSGVAVKDSSIAQVFNCTFVGNDFGFKNFNKVDPNSPTGAGNITNSLNTILCNNIT